MREIDGKSLTQEAESSDRSPRAVATLILGFTLTIIGTLLLLRIFFGVVAAMENPEPIGQIISAWEREIEGERPLIEFPTAFHLTTTATDASGEPIAPQVIAANGEVRLDFTRPGAIAILLILVAILVKIAAHLASAGIKIITAGPQRELLKDIVTELQRTLLFKGKRDEGAD